MYSRDRILNQCFIYDGRTEQYEISKNAYIEISHEGIEIEANNVHTTGHPSQLFTRVRKHSSRHFFTKTIMHACTFMRNASRWLNLQPG